MQQVDRSNSSVFKTYLSYAIPSSIAMVVSSIYIVIEGVILGRGVGAHALAAVNIAFPATILLNAFVIAVSVGGANLMSIRLGEKKPEEANNIFMQSLTVMVGIIIVIVSLGLVFLRPICIFLGSDDALLPDVMIYMKYFLLTSVFFVLSIGLNVFIRNDDNPRLSMYSSVVCTIATAVIVYVFVFILKLGIAGAALAGGLGEIFSLLVISVHFIKKKGVLRFAKPRFRKADIIEIASLGFPSMLTEMAVAFSIFCFNIVIMRRIGEFGVSAYSIANYVNSFIILILMGLSQGLQPIVSYNYGAKNMKTVFRAHRIAIKSAMTVSVLTILIMLCFSKYIIMLFDVSSNQLAALTRTVLLFSCVAYIPAGINMINITYYQSIENPKLSSVISILRGFVFIQTGLFVLPLVMGNTGIWISTFFGETLTLMAALFISRKQKPVHKEIA